jgi:transposase
MTNLPPYLVRDYAAARRRAREQQYLRILALLREGLSQSTIQQRLSVSGSTVHRVARRLRGTDKEK